MLGEFKTLPLKSYSCELLCFAFKSPYLRSGEIQHQGCYWSLINRKWHRRFRLLPKSMSLNDLERSLRTLLHFVSAAEGLRCQTDQILWLRGWLTWRLLSNVFSSSDISESTTGLKLKTLHLGTMWWEADVPRLLVSVHQTAPRKCANANMRKPKILWMQVLPLAEVALRTPVDEGTLLVYTCFFRSQPREFE